MLFCSGVKYENDATPRKPMIKPEMTNGLEKYCRHRLRSNIKNQSGSVAITTAACPELIYFSATATRPVPPTSIRMPAIDAVFIVWKSGHVYFPIRHHVNSSIPAMTY